jgi:hydrogenase/urease accessory protein HupE
LFGLGALLLLARFYPAKGLISASTGVLGAALLQGLVLGYELDEGLRSLLYFLRNGFRAAASSHRATVNDGNQIVPGKKYLTEQAATFLKFAKATTDPDVAVGFLDKAADLSARSEEAPDASPKAPDVEQPKG